MSALTESKYFHSLGSPEPDLQNSPVRTESVKSDYHKNQESSSPEDTLSERSTTPLENKENIRQEKSQTTRKELPEPAPHVPSKIDELISPEPDVERPEGRVYLDKALAFVANASNESLVGCAVAGAIVLYSLLGGLGLLIIGLTGGVVAQASLDGTLSRFKADSQSHNSLLIESLRGGRRKTGSKESQVAAKLLDGVPESLDFTSFRPETAAALAKFTDALIAKHVSTWYSHLIPTDTVFLNTCHGVVVQTMLSLRSRLMHKRPADLMLVFLSNSVSVTVVYLNELLAAMQASPSKSVGEALKTYIDSNPDGSLAHLVDQESQEKKLDSIADEIIQGFMDKSVYACTPMRQLVQQLISKIVLGTTLEKCSSEEFINSWIVALLDDEAKPDSQEVATGPVPSDIEPAIPEQPLSDEEALQKAQEAMEHAMREAERLNQEHLNMDRTGRQSPRDTRSLDLKRRSSEVGIGSPLAPAGTSETNLDRIAEPVEEVSFSLHNAKITVSTCAPPGVARMVNPPKDQFILEVTPEGERDSGWILVRHMKDFDALHAVLSKIAHVSGASSFELKYSRLPSWKHRTPEEFSEDLNAYLNTALVAEPLADCAAMKRFLAKDVAPSTEQSSGGFSMGLSAPKFPGISWSPQSTFENVGNVGKGVFGALAKAPKEIAGGGRSLIGGVFSKRSSTPASAFPGLIRQSTDYTRDAREARDARDAKERLSLQIKGRGSSDSVVSQAKSGSDDASPIGMSQIQGLTNMPTSEPLNFVSRDPTGVSGPAPILQPEPRATIGASRVEQSPVRSSVETESILEGKELPPPPFLMPDEYKVAPGLEKSPDADTKADTLNTPKPARSSTEGSEADLNEGASPLDEEEANLTVDLFMAFLSALYTLSPSFWSVRRSLLTAVKTFLLRSGTNQLESVRALMQASVLDAYSSDKGIANLVETLHRSVFPSPEDVAKRAAAKASEREDMEELRARARKLAERRALPGAIVSVMGAAATREAVGRMWESLMEKEVARGLVFGIMIQALKTVVQQ